MRRCHRGGAGGTGAGGRAVDSTSPGDGVSARWISAPAARSTDRYRASGVVRPSSERTATRRHPRRADFVRYRGAALATTSPHGRTHAHQVLFLGGDGRAASASAGTLTSPARAAGSDRYRARSRGGRSRRWAAMAARRSGCRTAPHWMIGRMWRCMTRRRLRNRCFCAAAFPPRWCWRRTSRPSISTRCCRMLTPDGRPGP